MKPLKTVYRVAVVCTASLFALSHMSFAGQGAEQHSPPKLSGQYRAFPAVQQFGAAVGDAYVFSARGDVYKGWTGTQSPDAFDFARAKAKEPGQTGKYTLAGDKITFRWSNNESETASISHRRDPKTGKTTLAIGPSYCFKLIPWNRMLSGTFDRSTYQGGFFDRTHLVDRFTFWPDGRFTMLEDKSGPSVQGKYTVSGATLTLTFPDGKQQPHSLHVAEDHKPPPVAILLDGQPYLAQTK